MPAGARMARIVVVPLDENECHAIRLLDPKVTE
jgi:hypothetical protein